MTRRSQVEISWCRNLNLAESLAKFFVANINSEYISHSELQGLRATALGQWHKNIVEIVAQEIYTRINQTHTTVSKQFPNYPVLVARSDSELVGLALVSFFDDAQLPYCVLEDIVVDRHRRHLGFGADMIRWIEHEAVAFGCSRLFLESGITNHNAHRLFEREGFTTCSIVMIKDI